MNIVVRSFALAAIFVSILSTSERTEAQELPERISIGTWNLEWFFDSYTGDNNKGLPTDLSAPSKEEWEWRLQKAADVIAEMNPTILALQEVEDRDVVWQLCKKLKTHGLNYRYAFVGGYEFATEQDVALIYQSGCVEYSRREQTDAMFQSRKYYNLGKHMFARFEWGSGESKQELLLCNVHLRARAEREDIRKRQCRLVHHWVQESIIDGENVVVLGDLNTEQDVGAVADGSDLAILKGGETGDKMDDLVDLNERLPADNRITHINDRQFDRILVSETMLADSEGESDFVFSKITNFQDLVVQGAKDGEEHFDSFYEIPQEERDLSDHYPVVAEFLFK